MSELTEHSIECPYCGEAISVLVDGSVPQQNYIEDCHVCCRPIVLAVDIDFDGTVEVVARSENE